MRSKLPRVVYDTPTRRLVLQPGPVFLIQTKETDLLGNVQWLDCWKADGLQDFIEEAAFKALGAGVHTIGKYRLFRRTERRSIGVEYQTTNALGEVVWKAVPMTKWTPDHYEAPNAEWEDAVASFFSEIRPASPA